MSHKDCSAGWETDAWFMLEPRECALPVLAHELLLAFWMLFASAYAIVTARKLVLLHRAFREVTRRQLLLATLLSYNVLQAVLAAGSLIGGWTIHNGGAVPLLLIFSLSILLFFAICFISILGFMETAFADFNARTFRNLNIVLLSVGFVLLEVSLTVLPAAAGRGSALWIRSLRAGYAIIAALCFFTGIVFFINIVRLRRMLSAQEKMSSKMTVAKKRTKVLMVIGGVPALLGTLGYLSHATDTAYARFFWFHIYTLFAYALIIAFGRFTAGSESRGGPLLSPRSPGSSTGRDDQSSLSELDL